MRLPAILKPKRPGNLLATLVACALVTLSYPLGAWFAPWSPKRGFGLVLGFVAALLFVFEMVYPLRRPRARPFGNAQRWIQAHIYLGVVAFVAVLVHAGFGLPHGTQGWLLLLLAFWTTATGLLGVWLQKWIPAALSGLRVEALYDRIPALVQSLAEEAEALVAEAGETLERFHGSEVRPLLARVRPSSGYLVDVRSGRDQALEPFRRISAFVDAEEKPKVEDLMGIVSDKLELDAQYSLQRLLRAWLWLHVPPAGLLMTVMFVHAFGWLWY